MFHFLLIKCIGLNKTERDFSSLSAVSLLISLSLPPNRFAERTTEEWIDIFDGSGIPCGPINDIKRVFEDPQVDKGKVLFFYGEITLNNVILTFERLSTKTWFKS